MPVAAVFDLSISARTLAALGARAQSLKWQRAFGEVCLRQTVWNTSDICSLPASTCRSNSASNCFTRAALSMVLGHAQLGFERKKASMSVA